jgi:hypothetical protein
MFESKYNVYRKQFHSFRTARVYAHGVSFYPRIINLLETSIRLLSKGNYYLYPGDRGSTVVKVLRYKSEGRWFDPRWCHWNFSLT